MLVYKPPSVRIDPRKRLQETSLAAPATIFGLWRRDTFFTHDFLQDFGAKKAKMDKKKLQKISGKVAHVK